MTSAVPLVTFYDLSGPKPWSPACWCTRYALNYKGIPYQTSFVGYPAIKAKCEAILDTTIQGFDHTVPIIEILDHAPGGYKALNDSTPIALLLNQRFTEKDGYKHLEAVELMEEYEKATSRLHGNIQGWILNDVMLHAISQTDGSREYFAETRESRLGPLSELIEKRGGEEEIVARIKVAWEVLRTRMEKEDGTGEPTYIDFQDAALVRWIEAASRQKYERLLKLYGEQDETFTKLMKKVEMYESY